MKTSIIARRAVILAVTALSLYACKTIMPTDDAARLSHELEQASALQKASKPAEANELISSVIVDPAFSSLSPALQHRALQFAAFFSAQHGERDRAYELITRSSTMTISDENDWILRFKLAEIRHDDADKVYSLTRLAQGWPSALHWIPYPSVQAAVGAARDVPEKEFDLLQALFAARYVSDLGIELSGLWRDLALLCLQRGDQNAALAAVERIASGSILMGVQVDNRFAGVRARLHDPINVDAAMADEIRSWQTAVSRNPDRLEPLLGLTRLQIAAGQSEQALYELDNVIARMGVQAQEGNLYKDQERDYVWILQRRTDALYGLSRFDEAVKQQEAASRVHESGHPNVNQTINLAELYNDLGRPSDARGALDRVGPATVSSYGRMQIEIERLKAALQLNDAREVTRCMTYLREHQSDSIATYELALVQTGDMVNAKQLLLTRLADPQQRIDALIAAQDYVQHTRTEPVSERRARWRAVVTAPEVRAAIAKVGVIERFNFDGPENY